jgi:hypothetical protein
MPDRNTQIRGGQIFDDTIDYQKLRLNNAPVDGYYLAFNNAAQKLEFKPGIDAVTEVPTGLIDGANDTYTLANTPSLGSLSVYLNGLFQQEGAGLDYQIAGNSIVFVIPPETGDEIVVSYSKMQIGSSGASGISDNDGDTRVTAEENTNEDKIRFFVGGSEQFLIDTNIIEPNVTNGLDLGSSTKAMKDIYLAGNLSDGTNSANVADIKDAVDLKHAQNSDTALDSGNANQVTAAELRSFVDSKGANSGLAELDSGGKVPTSQLPASLVGALTYAGTYNASTNTPTLGNSGSGGAQGDYYVVSVAGSTSLDGITDWEVGDWVVHNGSIWEKVDNTANVSSVNGAQGAVVLNSGDISESGNLYYTEGRVSANSDVAANTAARHTQGTDTTLGAMTADIDLNNHALNNVTDLTMSGQLSNGTDSTDIDNLLKGSIGFIIDGGDLEITAGIKGEITVPYDCTIKNVTLLADQTGSIVVDINQGNFASFPTLSSITAGATPTLSSAQKVLDSTLTGWTVDLSEGDILQFEVDSATTIERCSVIMQVIKR